MRCALYLVGALLVAFSSAALAQVELLYVAAGQASLRGTPWFALFEDGEVRVHLFGTTAFETRIQPALRAALRERAPKART